MVNSVLIGTNELNDQQSLKLINLNLSKCNCPHMPLPCKFDINRLPLLYFTAISFFINSTYDLTLAVQSTVDRARYSLLKPAASSTVSQKLRSFGGPLPTPGTICISI